jgi:hypothetical protein
MTTTSAISETARELTDAAHGVTKAISPAQWECRC